MSSVRNQTDRDQPDTAAPANVLAREGWHRHRRWAAAGAVVVTLGAAGAVTIAKAAPDQPARRVPLPPTAPVRRTDLVDLRQLDGTLTYADTFRVLAAGGGRGTLTWLPAVGDVIRRGHRAYEVDGHPVPLWYGGRPMWRTLAFGVAPGSDVKQLERNLRELGYGSGMTVDRHFTEATADAVKDWQEDRSVDRTGSVAPGDVVMEPRAIRVSAVSATAGGPARGVLYSATSTVRIVTVDVPVDQEQVVRRKAAVGIELPGGKTTTGHISDIGSVAQGHRDSANSADGQPGQSTETATIEIRITLDHPADAGGLDGAPVTVSFTGDERRNVLAVPVTALLAQHGGGYAVEVIDSAGRRRKVPVRTGMFAGGDVEVTGTGIDEGIRVEVPRS